MEESSLSETEADLESSPKTKKRQHLKQKFCTSWLHNDVFKPWLRPNKGNMYKATCSWCNVDLNAELTVIKRHNDSAKHLKNKIQVKHTSRSMMTTFLENNKDQQLENQVKQAEISLCGFVAEHNISYRAMDHLSCLLKSIFPDSKIANKLAIGRTKTRGVITNVIGATRKENLVHLLKSTKFSVLVDESTDIGTEKHACIVLRLFDGKKIISALWELVPLFKDKEADSFDCTAEHLFQVIVETFTQRCIPLSNIIGFGSDGCNLMMGEINSVASRFREICPGIVIFKCICHSLHLCSSEACKVLPRSCEDLSRNIYSFFKSSNKRQWEFKQFQAFAEVEIHRILHPSQTRWLSVNQVVKRILEQWSALQLYFTEKRNTERLLQTEQIFQNLHDPFMKLYFLFLDFILPKVSKMNELFQSDKVLITDLYSILENSYKELLKYFMRRQYVDQTHLSDLNPQDRTHFLNKASVYLGIHVMNELNSEKINFQPELKDYFLDKSVEFLSVLCAQIKKRFDFKENALQLFYLFKSNNALSMQLRDQYPSLFPLIDKLRRCSEEKKWQDMDDQWRLLPNYSFNEESRINSENEVDIFWGLLLNFQDETENFKDLSEFVLNALSIPHSNAACERVFSQVNLIKTKQRNRLITSSINGNLLTKDLIKYDFQDCIHFVPNQSMLNKMVKDKLYNNKEVFNQTEDDFYYG